MTKSTTTPQVRPAPLQTRLDPETREAFLAVCKRERRPANFMLGEAVRLLLALDKKKQGGWKEEIVF